LLPLVAGTRFLIRPGHDAATVRAEVIRPETRDQPHAPAMHHVHDGVRRRLRRARAEEASAAIHALMGNSISAHKRFLPERYSSMGDTVNRRLVLWNCDETSTTTEPDASCVRSRYRRCCAGTARIVGCRRRRDREVHHRCRVAMGRVTLHSRQDRGKDPRRRLSGDVYERTALYEIGGTGAADLSETARDRRLIDAKVRFFRRAD
jgi:hypothetical protein